MAKEFNESGPKVEKALYYAQEMGWRVFPMRPNTKKSAIDKWPQNATTNTEQIKAWWKQNPDYNIGILTGNNLCVIDMDTKGEGENGPETLHDWEEKNGALPDTLRVRTPTGSIHLYFRTKKDYGSTDQKHDGTTFFRDIGCHNNTGHCVVGAGSVINGKAYMFEAGFFPDEIELAEENETLTKFIQDALSKPNTKPAETSTKSEKHEKVKVPKEIRAGERHEQIKSIALSMRAQDFPEEAILSAITIINDERCEPPKWTEKDLKNLVKWVMTKDTSQAQIEAEKLKKEEAQAEAQAKVQAETTAQIADALVTLEDIEEREAEWLIPNILPKGQICLMCSDGGIGKTWVWVNVLASLSSGKRCILDDQANPFEHNFDPENNSGRQPVKTMFFSSEDSVSTVLKPRLELAGADFRNITTITLENDAFEQIKFDSQALGALIERERPALCVFDPLQAFVPANIRMCERNAMRQCMTKLIGWGEEFGCTFLIICHSNKRAGAYGRARVSDSTDIWDISRSILMLGETEEEGIKYISHEKSNYGPEADTILFSIEQDESTHQVLKFKGTTKKKDYDYVTARDYSRRGRPVTENTKTYIDNVLTLAGGYMLSGELKDQVMNALDASKGTYNKAKDEMTRAGLIETKKIGYNNWYTGKKGWYEALSADELTQLAKRKEPNDDETQEVKKAKK